MKHGFSRLNYFRYFLAWPGFLSLNARVLVRISVWEGLEDPRHKKICREGAGGEWVSLGRLGHHRHRKNMSGERREGGGVGDKRRVSGKRGVWRETLVPG